MRAVFRVEYFLFRIHSITGYKLLITVLHKRVSGGRCFLFPKLTVTINLVDDQIRNQCTVLHFRNAIAYRCDATIIYIN